jgi:DNA-binding CsgD family transcriptional regulator
MREVGGAMNRRFLLATAARIEGALADDDTVAAERFAEALGHFDAIPLGLPFERARVDVTLARRLRQAGRSEEAREPLERTLAILERLGAKPWEALVREELRAAGGPGTGAEPVADPAEALTAQEWRVAQLVADGMTNREVAGALFLSPKTIEHHLSGIYRKLGVRSRTQLARLFAADGERSAA